MSSQCLCGCLEGKLTRRTGSSAFAIIPDRWRSTWAILQSRASTLHAGIGPKVRLRPSYRVQVIVIPAQVTWVQTAALLEPLHAILGLVKSNPATSTMQVASRLFIVHFILSSFPVCVRWPSIGCNRIAQSEGTASVPPPSTPRWSSLGRSLKSSDSLHTPRHSLASSSAGSNGCATTCSTCVLDAYVGETASL